MIHVLLLANFPVEPELRKCGSTQAREGGGAHCLVCFLCILIGLWSNYEYHFTCRTWERSVFRGCEYHEKRSPCNLVSIELRMQWNGTFHRSPVLSVKIPNSGLADINQFTCTCRSLPSRAGDGMALRWNELEKYMYTTKWSVLFPSLSNHHSTHQGVLVQGKLKSCKFVCRLALQPQIQ